MKYYCITLWDIDGSTFKKSLKAFSFEDALFRIREMYRGYDIKSIELE